jgi:hypothetical protein
MLQDLPQIGFHKRVIEPHKPELEASVMNHIFWPTAAL